MAAHAVRAVLRSWGRGAAVVVVEGPGAHGIGAAAVAEWSDSAAVVDEDFLDARDERSAWVPASPAGLTAALYLQRRAAGGEVGARLAVCAATTPAHLGRWEELLARTDPPVAATGGPDPAAPEPAALEIRTLEAAALRDARLRSAALRALECRGRHDAALLLADALDADGDGTEAIIVRAAALRGLGRPEEALEALEARVHQTEAPSLLVALGACALELGDLQRADAVAERAEQLAADDVTVGAAAAHLAGRVQLELGALEAATRNLRRAVQSAQSAGLEVQQARARLDLAHALRARGQLQRARAELDDALPVLRARHCTPAVGRALLERARNSRHLGALDAADADARLALEHAIGVAPPALLGACWAELAHVWLLRGALQAADRAADTAFELGAERSAQVVRADLRAARGDPGGALAALAAARAAPGPLSRAASALLDARALPSLALLADRGPLDAGLDGCAAGLRRAGRVDPAAARAAARAAELLSEARFPGDGSRAARCASLAHEQYTALRDRRGLVAAERRLASLAVRDIPVPVGPYDLEELIARGGMGEVWRGRHRAQQVPVAIKLLSHGPSPHPRLVQMFAREVRAMAGLDHPAVVVVLDHGVLTRQTALLLGHLAEGTPWVALELAGGGTLEDHLGALDWPTFSSVLLALLGALAHAHARGVVHRDLKPSNVLLRGPPSAASVALGDFGIAGRVQDLGRGFAGTPGYMAPEQFGGGQLGPWTDLFAVGCLAHALWTGAPPWPECVRPMSGPVAMPGAPDGLEAWVGRLLAEAPRDRFAFAGDAARALRDLCPEAEAELAPAPTPLLGAGSALLPMRRPALEGRAEAQAALWDRFEAACDGTPSAAALCATPGMGAKALWFWVAERAHEEGRARVVPVPGGATPGEALSAALRRFLHTGDAVPDVQRRVASILAELGEDDAGFARSAAFALAGEGARAERRGASVELLHRLSAARPLIVACDDPALAEELAAAALASLGRADGGRVLWVVVARPEQLGDLDALLAHPEATRIELQPLGDQAMERLLERGLGLDPELSARIAARAAGNPQLAVQLAYGLAQEGRLVPTSGGLGVVEDGELALPESLAQAWHVRVVRFSRGLEPAERTALERAAAWGRSVDDEAWRALCGPGLDPDALAAALVANRLATATDSGWRWRHAAVRELIGDVAVAAGRAASHHALCAELLRERPERLPERARHLLAAGSLDQALDPLLASAELLLERRRLDGALAFAHDAERVAHGLVLDADDGRWTDLQLIQAAVRAHKGDYIGAVELGDRALARARTHGHPSREARALGRRGSALRELGDIDGARAALRASRDAWEALGDDQEVASATLGLALCEARVDPAQSFALTERALAAFEALGDDAGVVNCTQKLGIFAVLLDREDEGRTWLERVLEHPGITLRTRASSLGWLGLAAVRQGDLERADRAYAASLKAYTATGAGGVVFTEYNLGCVRARLGRVAEAEPLLERAHLRSVEQGRHTLARQAAAGLLSCVATGDAGAWRRAIELLRQATARGGRAQPESAEMLLLASERASAAGWADRARESAELAGEESALPR